jgi:hypothetical protein
MKRLSYGKDYQRERRLSGKNVLDRGQKAASAPPGSHGYRLRSHTRICPGSRLPQAK